MPPLLPRKSQDTFPQRDRDALIRRVREFCRGVRAAAAKRSRRCCGSDAAMVRCDHVAVRRALSTDGVDAVHGRWKQGEAR